MSRQERLRLCIERIGSHIPQLDHIIDISRVHSGEPAELLVAAARIEGALISGSTAADAQAELALLFLAAGDYSRSRRHAEEAVVAATELDVEARAHALLGRLDEVASDTEAALHHYRAAVNLNPTSWRHQLDLAALLITLNDAVLWDEADEALSSASALGGELPQVAYVRAQLLLKHGEFDSARRTFEELVGQGVDPFAVMAARMLSQMEE